MTTKVCLAGDVSEADPYTYLRDVLTRLPRITNHQIPDVTPEAWAKARRQLQRAA